MTIDLRRYVKTLPVLPALVLCLSLLSFWAALLGEAAACPLLPGEEKKLVRIFDFPAEDGAGVAASDYDPVKAITFSRGNQNHYFRENKEGGNILIVTGLVKNSFPAKRNFIRLRCHLLSADGKTLADRFVFAGNILSEEDLRTLPIREIYSRLSLKGGQDGRNMNIIPGGEIPFMFVFDQLPEAMVEYRIDPVGSDPGE